MDAFKIYTPVYANSMPKPDLRDFQKLGDLLPKGRIYRGCDHLTNMTNLTN